LKQGCDTGQDLVPYAAGFRWLTREIVDAVPLSVRGALPSWLEGALLRTGPSKFEVGTRTYNHWFDGLAMLHRFAFTGGAVTYSNRFLDSNAFRAAEATGKICYSRVCDRPLPNPVRPRGSDLRSQAHRQLLRQRHRLRGPDRRTHRANDAHALSARYAEDPRRVRL
jgi:carotenoid cleavage dioxygenase-like enzyme